MTETAQRLMIELARLSHDERAELARFLIDSLDEDGDDGDDFAWELELQQRADETHAGTAVGTPMERVFEKLRERYS